MLEFSVRDFKVVMITYDLVKKVDNLTYKNRWGISVER